MVQAGCRARFTVNDLNFVVETLARSTAGADSLFQLLRDPNALDPVLDDEALHRALIDRPDCLTVSPPFYFYVLVRRAFLRHGLDDRHLCDYVASVLAEFTRQEALQPPLASALAPAGGRSFGYLGDLLDAASGAPAAQAFGLRCFLADYALFLSGLFKERVDARRHGAPGIGFYEAVGQASYRAAAALPQAARKNVRGLFENLAEAFREVRLSLNEMADRTLHLEPPPV